MKTQILEGVPYRISDNILYIYGTNIPIGTVKTRIFVAKRKLRKRLHTYGVNYGLLENLVEN